LDVSNPYTRIRLEDTNLSIYDLMDLHFEDPLDNPIIRTLAGCAMDPSPVPSIAQASAEQPTKMERLGIDMKTGDVMIKTFLISNSRRMLQLDGVDPNTLIGMPLVLDYDPVSFDAVHPKAAEASYRIGKVESVSYSKDDDSYSAVSRVTNQYVRDFLTCVPRDIPCSPCIYLDKGNKEKSYFTHLAVCKDAKVITA
jgi:hypothetical protein